MTYIQRDSFGSQFNSDWASMLLVAIDEVFLIKKKLLKEKYLSTTNKDKIEAKGKDREEAEFFRQIYFVFQTMKTILFKLMKTEIRFWIRKINPIKSWKIQNFLKI